jgi:hypothetical protein
VLFIQRLRKRGAAAHTIAHTFDQSLRVLAFWQVHQNAERAIERLSRAKQCCQLVRELRQLIAVERTTLEKARKSSTGAARIGRLGFQRRVALILQAHDDFIEACGLHLSLQNFASGTDSAVTELAHATYLFPCAQEKSELGSMM